MLIKAIYTVATNAMSPVLTISKIVSGDFTSNTAPTLASSISYPSGACISVNTYLPYGTFSIIYSPFSLVTAFSTKTSPVIASFIVNVHPGNNLPVSESFLIIVNLSPTSLL